MSKNADDGFLMDVARAKSLRKQSGEPNPKRGANGKSANVFFTPSKDNSLVIDILTINPLADEAPQAWIVTLAPPQTANVPNPSPADPQTIGGPFMDTQNLMDIAPTVPSADILISNAVANLEWGHGSVIAKAQCDFGNGLTVNLFASYLNVRAFVEANNACNPVLYRLGAFVVPGISSRARAQRTIRVVAGAIGAESAVFAVPKFAKSVTLTGANAAHASPYNGIIRFWRSFGGLADASNVCDYFFSGNVEQPMPVPNGATYFSVINQIANAENQAVFELAI